MGSNPITRSIFKVIHSTKLPFTYHLWSVIILYMTTIIPSIQPDTIIPDTFAKGEAFQDYVSEVLFPDDQYELLYKTPDYITNQKRRIKSTMDPDFKFRSRSTGKEFWIEVKYRSQYFDDSISWLNYYQIKRYRELNKETPVYIVIGIGNYPTLPSEIFLIPIGEIRYNYKKLFRSFLRKYSVEKKDGVFTPTL
ncbi:MAG TPA: hypothetical protein VGA85_03705 [Dehalococcoidales bacterium]